jgi:hypothetical protein
MATLMGAGTGEALANLKSLLENDGPARFLFNWQGRRKNERDTIAPRTLRRDHRFDRDDRDLMTMLIERYDVRHAKQKPIFVSRGGRPLGDGRGCS